MRTVMTKEIAFDTVLERTEGMAQVVYNIGALATWEPPSGDGWNEPYIDGFWDICAVVTDCETMNGAIEQGCDIELTPEELGWLKDHADRLCADELDSRH